MKTGEEAAFPRPASVLGNQYRADAEGLTKREWFAGIALAGLATGLRDSWGPMSIEQINATIARRAWELADAMLTAWARWSPGGRESRP